jgi:uncharacterized OB-fold protein
MPGPIDYSKLEILPDHETQDWWAGTKEKKYLVRQCRDCGHKWFPPGPVCGKCNSFSVGWFETSGKGTIHSYTVIPKGILPAFAQTAPYVVALIELDDCTAPDGSVVRTGGVLVDDEDAAAIGLPVQVVFDATPNPDIVIPRWKISGGAPGAWKFTG